MIGATTRVPQLEGALNFRDLGGYQTRDGRTVRRNMVYRSGTTHALTAADLASLASLGVRYVYDLRSNKERQDHPNRLRGIANLDYRYSDHDQLPGDIKRLLALPQARAAHSHQLMIEVYQRLPYEFAAAFRALFFQLGQGNIPLVFNCTAGKDRTGVAAALLLTALGVPREAVLADYLLTRQFFERSCEMILNEGGVALFADMDRAVWEPLMQVHPEYLEAMFDQVEASHGSVERYLSEQLGIDEPCHNRLRGNLLD